MLFAEAYTFRYGKLRKPPLEHRASITLQLSLFGPMGKHANLRYNRNQGSAKKHLDNFGYAQTYKRKETGAKYVQDPMLEPLTSANNQNPENKGPLAQVSPAPTLQERQRRVRTSYQRAIRQQGQRGRLANFPWFTWLITLVTCSLWCLTAYQVALNAGAHTLKDVLANVFSNSEDGNVLIAFGAKYNAAIIEGQYWRLVTPMFLHANLLHLALNMLNFFILGLIAERIFGHIRFVLIYLLTGVASALASFAFAPQEVSVGASGAIFGLVGAYSIFILVHRLAFPRGGLTALVWLILVIGLNLGLGFVIPNVDNYAHVGGLLSGCLLGWFFTPFYRVTTQNELPVLADAHSLKRRWPLALLMIVITILIAIIAIHFVGG